MSTVNFLILEKKILEFNSFLKDVCLGQPKILDERKAAFLFIYVNEIDKEIALNLSGDNLVVQNMINYLLKEMYKVNPIVVQRVIERFEMGRDGKKMNEDQQEYEVKNWDNLNNWKKLIHGQYYLVAILGKQRKEIGKFDAVEKVMLVCDSKYTIEECTILIPSPIDAIHTREGLQYLY